MSGEKSQLRTLIVACLRQTVFSTPIKFAYSANHEVYFVSRVPDFRQYLQSVMQKPHGAQTRVILINEDLGILIQMLHMIYRSGTESQRIDRKNAYLASYKQNIASVSDAARSAAFTVSLPQGHADFCVPFETLVLQNCDSVSEANCFSRNTIFTQQALRYLALKHGATFGAVSGVASVLDYTPALESLISHVFLPPQDAKSHTFSPAGSLITNDAYSHQLLRQGWDSWSRILLVAKSAPVSSTTGLLLTSDGMIGELNDLYTDYIEAIHPQAEEKLLQYVGVVNPEKSAEMPAAMTYQDFMALLIEPTPTNTPEETEIEVQ